MINNKRWILRKAAQKDNIKPKDYNPYILRILSNRGINDETSIKKFIEPSIDYLYDPFLLPDMQKAVDMIKNYVNDGKKIVVYGDYDADGITSTSIIINFFRKIGANTEYYIPDRIDEGYGLNIDAIDTIIKGGAELIITVDCGITSVDEVSYCRSRGVDIIITDHHECKDIIPDTIVINAKRSDAVYPFRDLSGAGIAFKLVTALKTAFNSIDPMDYIDLAAIGTVADVVSLLDENRIIVSLGIEKIKSSPNCGISALVDACGIARDNINSGNISFALAPRINAAGRISDASAGVELFTCANIDEAKRLAGLLNEGNKKRQQIGEQILSEAEKQIEDKYNPERDLVLVLNSPEWHVGVIGIVASRLAEKYYRPVIMLSGSKGILRGSARSISGFDMFKSLAACSNLLDKFGGHSMAAGLSISDCNIEAFKAKINDIAREVLAPETLVPSVFADCEIYGEDITNEMAENIKLLEPFGNGNPSPLFLLCDVNIDDIKTVGVHDKHLKLRISTGKKTFNAVAFNMGYNINDYFRNNTIDILCSISLDTWNGRNDVQLVIRDMRHSPFSQIRHEYYTSLKNIIQGLAKPINFESGFGIPDYDMECREKVITGTVPSGSLILVSNENLVRNILHAGNFLEYFVKDNEKAEAGLPQVIINPDFGRISYKSCSDIYIMDHLVLYNYFYNMPLFPENIIVHNCCGALDDDLSFIMSLMPEKSIEEKIFAYLSGISMNGYVRCSVKDISDALSLNLICVYYNLKSMIQCGIISMSVPKGDIIVFRINKLREGSIEDSRCSKNFKAVFSNLDRLKIPEHNSIKGE